LYQTTEALPENLKDKLPDIKEFKARLEEMKEVKTEWRL
jgi:hypothetical protein